jgi:agmatinase
VTQFILNAAVEIVPKGSEQFEIRSSLFGSSLSASRYQVGLLQQFETAKAVKDCLSNLPFEQDESEKFLEDCIEAALLLPVDAESKAILPKRVHCSPSIAGAPQFDPTHPSAFTFLGIPFDALTTGSAGARFGPASIRASSGGIRYRLDPNRFTPLGFYDYASGRKLLENIELSDAGDVFSAPGETVEVFFERISAVVSQISEAGSIPLIMGGDHSITWPVIRTLPHPELGIIHFDAHTDLGETMPGIALHHGSVFTHVLEKLEYVSPLVQLGLRGMIDASEHQELKDLTQFGMDQIRSMSAEEMLAQIPDDRPYYLSIDIDVVDPAFAPSTGTPVPNGMHPHELKSLVHSFARKRELIAVDVVEVGHCTEASDGTAGLALELLMTAADGIVLGMSDKLDAPGAD